MRGRILRSLLPGIVALVALSSASCEQTMPRLIEPPGSGTTEPELFEASEIEAALDGGARQPAYVLVQATEPGPALETRTLDEARDALDSDPKLEPLREALVEGGWDREQRAQMVYFAGTHRSGAPEDSIRHRQQQVHDELSAALQTFRRDLAEAEEREGVRVDREALHEAGVVTRIDVEVIQ